MFSLRQFLSNFSCSITYRISEVFQRSFTAKIVGLTEIRGSVHVQYRVFGKPEIFLEDATELANNPSSQSKFSGHDCIIIGSSAMANRMMVNNNEEQGEFLRNFMSSVGESL